MNVANVVNLMNLMKNYTNLTACWSDGANNKTKNREKNSKLCCRKLKSKHT